MGSFSYITLDNYPVFDCKNGYYQNIVDLIFLPTDFISETRPYSSRNEIFWGDAYKNENGTFQFAGYRQIAKKCIHRLEIYGHSIENAKKDFSRAKKVFREEGNYDYYQYKALSEATFKQYVDTLREILTVKQKKYNDVLLTLKDILIAGDLSFHGQSISHSLFTILSLLPENSIIEYDLTDVFEYADEKELSYEGIEKIIILTEGRTDVEFISKSIEMLYPHISPYYHFINFDEYKVESNASALVKFVKSLIASNVKHPIIALFDNDTAGIMEMNKLKSIVAPRNFRILKYPNLKLAEKYPTIGPKGLKKMDLNEYACSIEMYFGEDVLVNGDDLTPVIWKGYNEKEKKYQGEILDKGRVQKAFREKLRNKKGDFNDMDLLLKEIFSAFKKGR